MLQHRLSIFICCHLKNIKGILFPISSPVILRRLERCIHLIDPGRCQSCISAAGGKHTASSVKAAGLTVILPCDINQTLRTGKSRKHHIILIVINIRNIPGKAKTITVVFTFCHICRPLLGKGFRVYQLFFYQLVKPLDSFLIPFLYSGVDYFALVCHCKMISRISIALSKSVNQDRRILISVVYNKGHRNHSALNLKFLFQFCGVIAKGNQCFLQFIHRRRYFQLQIIQPFFVDIGNVSNCLNSLFSCPQLFDPWE